MKTEIDRQEEPGWFERGLIPGALTAAALGLGWKLLSLIVGFMVGAWDPLLTFNGLEPWFTGEYRLLVIPASVLLTALLIVTLGLAMSSGNKTIVRLIGWSGLGYLPWAPKYHKESGQVVRVRMQELVMWRPAVALVGGRPEVGYITGDEGQDATFFDADGTPIGHGDWVSVFFPAIPAIFNGKTHPVPKRIVLPLRNRGIEVLGWLQSQGKKPIHWQPQRWNEVPLDPDFLELLEKTWGIVLNEEGRKRIREPHSE